MICSCGGESKDAEYTHNKGAVILKQKICKGCDCASLDRLYINGELVDTDFSARHKYIQLENQFKK